MKRLALNESGRHRTILALLLVFQLAPVFAQVGINPQYQEIRLDEERTSHTFRLYNFTDEEKTFQASVSHWDFDEHNNVIELPAEADTLARWLIVNPARFTLPPGEYQAVRYALHPRARFDEGEHRAMLFFDEELSDDQIESAEGLRLRVRVGAAIYGQVGERHRGGVLVSAEVDGNRVVLTLRNDGNANDRLRGSWTLWNAARFPGSGADETEGSLGHSALPATPVLPGRTQILRFSLPADDLTPGGEYVLDINAELGGEGISVPLHFRRDG